jgi:hypothetical protein
MSRKTAGASKGLYFFSVLMAFVKMGSLTISSSYEASGQTIGMKDYLASIDELQVLRPYPPAAIVTPIQKLGPPEDVVEARRLRIRNPGAIAQRALDSLLEEILAILRFLGALPQKLLHC